jgi:plasmid stabilization system protein ParE
VTLRWSERALTDLLAIGEYIAADNPTAARAWVERLRQRAMKASMMPRSGRVVPEIARDDVREVLQRSYRIVRDARATTCGSALSPTLSPAGRGRKAARVRQC